MANLASHIRQGRSQDSGPYILFFFNPSASCTSPQTMGNEADFLCGAHRILCMSANIPTPIMKPFVPWSLESCLLDGRPGRTAMPGIAFNFHWTYYYFFFERDLIKRPWSHASLWSRQTSQWSLSWGQVRH